MAYMHFFLVVCASIWYNPWALTRPVGGLSWDRLPAWRPALPNIMKGVDVMSLDKESKAKIITEFSRHEGDTGSPEVQIALLTNRIVTLTDHLRVNSHDESSRRGLLKLVGQRRRLLAYIRHKEFQRYLALTDRLNIRRK
jgi:small subunit ribosomal protein S15